MTITEIAAAAGISRGYLSQMVHGNKHCPYRHAKTLARITGTEVMDWLELDPRKIQEIIRNLDRIKA